MGCPSPALAGRFFTTEPEPLLSTQAAHWNHLVLCATWCCYVWLFRTLWTVACHAPSVHGILQARILEWAAIPFSRESSQPRGRTCIPYIWIGPEEFFKNSDSSGSFLEIISNDLEWDLSIFLNALYPRWFWCAARVENHWMNGSFYFIRRHLSLLQLCWSDIRCHLLSFSVLQIMVCGGVQSLSCVQLFATPWAAALQTAVFHLSQSLVKFMFVELVMLSNHLICCPLLCLPSVFPSIRVFSSELALCIRRPKYWSFSFHINPSSG